jgi:hypothetical protein
MYLQQIYLSQEELSSAAAHGSAQPEAERDAGAFAR